MCHNKRIVGNHKLLKRLALKMATWNPQLLNLRNLYEMQDVILTGQTKEKRVVSNPKFVKRLMNKRVSDQCPNQMPIWHENNKKGGKAADVEGAVNDWFLYAREKHIPLFGPTVRSHLYRESQRF